MTVNSKMLFLNSASKSLEVNLLKTVSHCHAHTRAPCVPAVPVLAGSLTRRAIYRVSCPFPRLRGRGVAAGGL